MTAATPELPVAAASAQAPHAALLRRGWLALLLLAPLPVLAESSGLDVWLENAYFDPVRHLFPWREVWWFNTFLHDGLRSVMVFVALGVAGLLLLSLAAPHYARPYVPAHFLAPRRLAYLLVAMLAGPLLIGLLKDVTARPCPWSLSMYGGLLPYAGLFDAPLFDWQSPGKCFPGAHASGGFGLLAFVPLLAGPRRLAMLALALGLGLFMGWTRMMQGAHFLSHNLWSAWICWAVTLLSFHFIRPWEAAHGRITEVREPA